MKNKLRQQMLSKNNENAKAKNKDGTLEERNM